MFFRENYDKIEVECKFCNKKVKPIIKRNKMKIGFGMMSGPFLEVLNLVLQKSPIDIF